MKILIYLEAHSNDVANRYYECKNSKLDYIVGDAILFDEISLDN